MNRTKDSDSRAPATSRPRLSLKEIAARASQAGPRPVATPIPAAATPIPAGTPGPGPTAATGVKRPVEADGEDSGIVDLNMIRSMATAQQKAAAEKAQPAAAGLFEEDERPAASAAAASAKAASVPVTARSATVPQAGAKKRGSGGAVAGVLIAVVGVAAAAGLVLYKKHLIHLPGTVAVESRPAAPPPVAEAPAAPAQPAAVADQAAPPTDPAAAEASKADDPAEAAKVARGGPGASPAHGPVAAGAAPAAAPPDKPAEQHAAAAPAPAGAPGKPGDLNGEIRKAVGDKGSAASEGATPEPASGGGKGSANQNIPEQPSQGSVQAAIGSVMGGAKACVSAADDVTRAQITFGSSGSVTNVSVSGWAASNGQAACVKSALKGASVGAFARPSFTVGVTIRP